MPVTQDRLTRLREFGLSEYAARSYLALLDLGIAEARDVSSISKVPQAKIYHVLEQLHDKGLVVILPEFPKKYAPVPFEEYLGRLYDEHTKAAKSIDDQRGELAELFRVMGDTDVGDRGFFTVIRGRRNVLSKIEEMVGQTEKDLIVLGTAGTASRIAHMLPEIRRARERNVRVRIMTPVDAETVDKLPVVAESVELRARELGPEEQSSKVAIVVSDASRAFLIHFVPDDPNLYSGKDIGVFTDQEAMVAAIQAIVEPHWERASPYERRRGELLEGRDPEFTRVYTTRAESAAAIAAAIDRGAKEALMVNSAELTVRSPEQRVEGERIRARGISWRGIMNFRDVAAVDDYLSTTREDARVKLRHLRTPAVSGQLVLDAREAFFTVGAAPSGDQGAEVVIHTNSPVVVKRLRDHFETLWAYASDIEDRRRELEIFPDLQPGDIGVGRLFSVLRDAVVVADRDGRIALWNPAAAPTFGREVESVRGIPITELVVESERKALLDRLARLLEGGLPDRDAEFFETIGARASGAAFPMEVTLSILPSEGARRYVLAVCRDITVRRSAQERVQRAYERMTDAFYALDRDWRFVYRNPVVRAMQGSRPDAEIDGKVIWDAFPDLLGTKFETEFRRAIREMRTVSFVEEYPRLGKVFEVTAYPGEDGLSVYFRDISETPRAPARVASSRQRAG